MLSPLAEPRFRRVLLEFAARRVPTADVEDLVQTVLCDALASGKAPEDAREIRAWLLAIARNKIADLHRKTARESLSEPPEVAVAPAPIEERALADWAERHAPRTPEAERTLHWMAREGEGEKLEHIAASEALPAAQVRQRVSRLRRWMRERWLAELAAVAALAVLAVVIGVALRSPTAELAPERAPAARASSARLAGRWRLVEFEPDGPLDATRQAFVDRQVDELVLRFEGDRLVARSKDFELELDYAVPDARGDQFEVLLGGPVNPARATCELRGQNELVVRSDAAPWRGTATLRRE